MFFLTCFFVPFQSILSRELFATNFATIFNFEVKILNVSLQVFLYSENLFTFIAIICCFRTCGAGLDILGWQQILNKYCICVLHLNVVCCDWPCTRYYLPIEFTYLGSHDENTENHTWLHVFAFTAVPKGNDHFWRICSTIVRKKKLIPGIDRVDTDPKVSPNVTPALLWV